MNFRPERRALTLAIAAAALPGATRAQAYPSRPITLVLPTAPGSAIDTVARRLEPLLSKALGQPLVLDNKPGSGGLIGAKQLVKSAPDGYTLAVISSTYAASPALYPMSFDPVRDIQPIAIVSGGPPVLVVNPKNVNATNLAQLLELARARASTTPLYFGNSGNGSTVQMSAAQMAILAKITVTHVPYKGMNTYMTDLIGGAIDAGFLPPVVALPFIKDGRLRPIGVASATRLAVLPHVPTLQESGLPGFQVDGWVAVIAPAKLPRPILERLNAEVVKAARSPEFVKHAQDNGGTVIASSIEEAEKTIARDIEHDGQLIKRLGIKAD